MDDYDIIKNRIYVSNQIVSTAPRIILIHYVFILLKFIKSTQGQIDVCAETRMLRELFGALFADQEPPSGPISQDLFEGEDYWSPTHLYDTKPQILVEDSIIADEFTTFLSHGALLALAVVLLLYGSYKLFHFKNMKKDENIKYNADTTEA